jgi:hypothetical protein
MNQSKIVLDVKLQPRSMKSGKFRFKLIPLPFIIFVYETDDYHLGLVRHLVRLPDDMADDSIEGRDKIEIQRVERDRHPGAEAGQVRDFGIGGIEAVMEGLHLEQHFDPRDSSVWSKGLLMKSSAPASMPLIRSSFDVKPVTMTTGML